jgi:hypothetical protein
MAPNPFSDRPNNYDEGRVLNWSGDDNSSRSIGLFKFKLGLFEFVLPTWSMTDDHEDNIINANRLRLSVPNPTRRKKKDEKANRIKQTKKWDIDEHTNTHITSHIDQSSQHLQQIQEKLNEEKKFVTVAYIIIIPTDDGFDDDNGNNNRNEEGNNSGSTRKRRQHRAMKALANSIEVAHIESKYDYQLYALSLGSLTLSSWTMREYSKLGIETIVVNETDLNGNNSVVDMATEPTKTVIVNRRLDVVELNKNDGEEEGRNGMLSQHDIIVQLSLNSMIVHSMDDVFDAIMGEGHTSDIVGIVESHSDVHGGRKEERVIERLELTNSAIVNDSNLYIFKSTSQREHTSFFNRLACQLSKKQRMTTDADQDPSMSGADCSTWIANEDVRLLLDRCIYDAGSNGRNCLHALTLDDIRLARFSGKLVEPHSNNTNVDQEEDKASSCRTPWEYRSEVKCLNDHVGHINEKICYYLCKKWFQLVDISK